MFLFVPEDGEGRGGRQNPKDSNAITTMAILTGADRARSRIGKTEKLLARVHPHPVDPQQKKVTRMLSNNCKNFVVHTRRSFPFC